MLIFFFLFIFYLVVQHSKTQSEPVSETVVTVTVTRLTVTRTPTKALVVTCPQKRPSSWKLLESNHRLWNKVGRKISKTLCTSDTSLRLPKPLSFTLMSNCSAESHNWILNLEHFLSPALFSTLFRFFLCWGYTFATVCLRVWVYQSRQAHYVFISPTTSVPPFRPSTRSSRLWNFDNGTWKMT